MNSKQSHVLTIKPTALMRALKSLALLVAIPVIAAGCGNLSVVSDEGTTNEPVWPAIDNLDPLVQRGIFPDQSAFQEVKKGMTKDQMYHLLGVPHFNEGIFGVREWDYLLHYHTPGQGVNDVTSCQFKVLYDKNGLTSSFHWKAAEPVDATCPPSGQQGSASISLASDVLFGFDNASLSTGAYGVLNELAEQIKQTKGLSRIMVYGYTDHLGDMSYNVRLSQQRADAVHHYLVQQGISSHLITAQGLGDKKPVVSCHGREGQALISCLAPNRRVEIVVNETIAPELHGDN